MKSIKQSKLTIKLLQQEGVPVAAGNKFFPKGTLAKRPPPVGEIRRRLAKFKGSLAEEVARIRETE